MSLYGRWMEGWERELTLRDKNRQMFPFEWGMNWIFDGSSGSGGGVKPIADWAALQIANSEEFFHCPEIRGERLGNGVLRFETPAPGMYAENNEVFCRIFSGDPERRCAIVVVPQWNGSAESHVSLCKVLSWLGFTAVRLTLPYHEHRAPGGMPRADYMVGPNIGRTLHAARQAVLEVRQVVQWLYREGYQHVGVMGTSLGSCVSYLAFTHDPRIEVGVFNHVSSHFAEVVWTGLSTRYVRWGLEGNLGLEELRRCWAPLSPYCYIDRLRDSNRPHLMITARYDLTFLPALSELVFERYRDLNLSVDRVDLPCGHYTTAHFPFNVLDAWNICRYFQSHLGRERISESSQERHAGS